MTSSLSTIDITVSAEEAGERLDKMLSRRLPELSRSRIQALIAEGAVRSTQPVAATIGDASLKVKQGLTLTITVPQARDALPRGEDIPLSISFEDEHLIVIDKPAGLVVHPGPGNDTGTLVNALIAHCGDSLSGIGGEKRPGIVHRIDKDTSGLLVIAKHDRAHQGLSKQFANHSITRTYAAFVWGAPTPRKGTVDAPIARSPHNRKKMGVVPERVFLEGRAGKHAITHYVTETAYGPPAEPTVAQVACSLETGRTHQIRVHMTHIGHPLIGDLTYGRGLQNRRKGLSDEAIAAIEKLGRQALHARTLGFIHPITKDELCFESGLPADLQALATALKSL